MYTLLLLQVSLSPAVSAVPRRLSEAGNGTAANSGDPNCPCLTTMRRDELFTTFDSTFVNADGTTRVTLSGIDYTYPPDYGFSSCAQHDDGQLPYCNVANPPEWCADTWCYVDKDTCNRVNLKSSYFVDIDLYYSYATCGSLNSFDSWFGANAAADGTHTITDIADLLTGYLTSITNTMEANQAEVAASGSTCNPDSSCPCTTCTSNVHWGGNAVSCPDPQYAPPGSDCKEYQKIDPSTVTIGMSDRVDLNSAEAKQDQCLAEIVADSFERIGAPPPQPATLGACRRPYLKSGTGGHRQNHGSIPPPAPARAACRSRTVPTGAFRAPTLGMRQPKAPFMALSPPPPGAPTIGLPP